jgi:hypothetical protein
MFGSARVGQHGLIVLHLNAGNCTAETDVNRLRLNSVRKGGEQRAAVDAVCPKTRRVGEANKIASVLAYRMKLLNRRAAGKHSVQKTHPLKDGLADWL